MNNKNYWVTINEVSNAEKSRAFNNMLEGKDGQNIIEFANTLGMRGVFYTDRKLQLGKKSTMRLIEEVIIPMLSNNGKIDELEQILIKLTEVQKDNTPKYRCDFEDCTRVIYKAFVGNVTNGLYFKSVASMDYIKATLICKKSKAQINKLN